MSEQRRTYVRAHDAWWWPAVENLASSVVKEMFIGLGDGEFTIKWHSFNLSFGNDHRPLCPQICVFSDSTHAFVEIPEFFTKIAALGEDYTVEAVCDILDGLGFKDETEETRAG